MSDLIRIDPVAADGRFSRFELIGWWDQARLAGSRVLLIGVGALGNEILKNLALLGFGQVFAADLDRVENSNLSRSILFREQDCGRPKAEAAAARASEIYPGLKVQPFQGNVVYDLGLGVYRWADVILGGLDNREARVAINQAAARVGKPWIDGAIERLDGVARVFDASTGPCYECTMGDADWKMLEARRSCALLTRNEMEQGKVPTTPTTASVIAGIQTQEAVKMIHGLETLAGHGFVFEGHRHQSYVVQYTQKDDCPAHDLYEPLEVLDWRVGETRVNEFLDRVRADLGPKAIIETNQDLLKSLSCADCETEETLLVSLGKVTENQARCPKCQGHRTPTIYHVIDGEDASILDKTLGELGVPAWDILCGRAGMDRRFYEFAGDRATLPGVALMSPRHENPSRTNASQEPDIRQLDANGLPEAPFPGGRDQDFRIFFAPDIHSNLWSHARADTSVEVCGVLVGRWERDGDGPYVAVSGSILGDAAESKFAEVTFTHQTWAKINDEMDRNYPNLTIVGWYHTHPDFGIFLSDRDVFINQHFFSEAGHIAHVIDPIRKTEGSFVWRRGKPTLTPHFWVGSDLKTSTAAGTEVDRSSVMASPTAHGPSSAAPPRGLFLPPLESLLAYLALLLLGYLLASYRTSWSESRLIEGTVAHYGIWQGLRPGLGNNLDEVSGRLRLLSSNVETLAADHLKRLEKDEKLADKKKDWQNVREVLAESTVILAKIKATYELSPAEATALREQIIRKLQELEPSSTAQPASKEKSEPIKEPASKEKAEPTKEPVSKEKAEPAKAPASDKQPPKKS